MRSRLPVIGTCRSVPSISERFRGAAQIHVYFTLLYFTSPEFQICRNVVVVKGKADAGEMRTLRDLLSHLSVCVVSKKSKNLEVLHIAAEVSEIFSHFVVVVVVVGGGGAAAAAVVVVVVVILLVVVILVIFM